LDCNRERWANAQKGVGYAVLFVNQYLADRFARELLSFRHPMPKVIMPALVHRTGTSFPLAWTCPRQTWLVHHFTVSRKFTEGTNNVEGSAPIKAHRPCRRVSLVRLFLKRKTAPATRTSLRRLSEAFKQTKRRSTANGPGRSPPKSIRAAFSFLKFLIQFMSRSHF